MPGAFQFCHQYINPHGISAFILISMFLGFMRMPSTAEKDHSGAAQHEPIVKGPWKKGYLRLMKTKHGNTQV